MKWCILVVALSCSLVAAAEQRASSFGLGVAIGSPTEISSRVGVGGGLYEAGLGGSFLGDRGFQFHVDRLWMPLLLMHGRSVDAHFYWGVGARALVHHIRKEDEDLHLGARFPLGIVFDLRGTGVPLDTFLEAAPIVDVISGESIPHFDLNAAIGVRYLFF